MPSRLIQSHVLLVFLAFFSAMGSPAFAKTYSTLDYRLREAPHFLEGMLDPGITMSIVKIEGEYPLVQGRSVDGFFQVTELFTTGGWPPSVTLTQKNILEYASLPSPEVLYEYSKMKFLVFEARRNGKQDYKYGIPYFRIDTQPSEHWSKYLTPAAEAEKAVKELWELIAQKHSGEVQIKDAAGRVLAAGRLNGGHPEGRWTYRYFDKTSPGGVLQKRKVQYQGSTQQLVLNEVRGELHFQYETTPRGYKEMQCGNRYCDLIERIGDRQIFRRFSRKEGRNALTTYSEGYLDAYDKFITDGEVKRYDPDSGELISFNKYRNGKDITSRFDLKRRGLTKPEIRYGYCGGSYSTLLEEVYDTLSVSVDSIVRMAITTHTGGFNKPAGVAIPVDTVIQTKSPTVLSAYRVKGRDTSYVFYFDAVRGYGVSGSADLSSSNSLRRTLWPAVDNRYDNFWPLNVKYDKSDRSDTLYRRRLLNDTVVLSQAKKGKAKHGLTTQRYSTGQLAAQGSYVNDRPTGDWSFFAWDGRPLLTINIEATPKKELAETLLGAGVWQWMYPLPSRGF